MHNPSCKKKLRLSLHSIVEGYSPIPRVKIGPGIKLILETPDEGHHITVCCGFQTAPAAVPQTISRKTRDKCLSVNLELVRVSAKGIGARNEIVEITVHLGEIKGLEKFESRTQLLCSFISIGDLFLMPVIATNV